LFFGERFDFDIKLLEEGIDGFSLFIGFNR
jgi:hypothetical protein